MQNADTFILTKAEFVAYKQQDLELNLLRGLNIELAKKCQLVEAEKANLEIEKAKVEVERDAAVANEIVAQAKIEKLEDDFHSFKKYIKAFFERGSERYKGGSVDPNQLDLFANQLLDQTQQVDLVEPQKRTGRRNGGGKGNRKKHPGRNPLPDDLPKREIVIEPEYNVAGWSVIGIEVTKELEYQPGYFYLNLFLRPKYARPGSKEAAEWEANKEAPQASTDSETADVVADAKAAQTQPTPTAQEEPVEDIQADSAKETLAEPTIAKPPVPEGKNVVIAPMPIRVIDKGIPGPNLLAHMLVSKFVDHLPWYRQMDIFRRSGVNIDEETANGWMKKATTWLQVIFDRMKRELLTKNYLMGDESTVKVLDRLVKGKTHLGYYWVYMDPVTGLTVFIYEKGRDGEYVRMHLKDFVGTLQTDAYAGYDLMSVIFDIILAGCWAHARRKFNDAKTTDRRSEWFLQKIQKLYAIERFAKQNKMDAAERLELRKNSTIILEEIKKKMIEMAPVLTPKSDLKVAINYALNNWKELMVFTQDGNIEIDNNLIENRIRPLAIGRKNWLFAGNHEAAQRNGVIYSITATCKSLGINPYTYLADVFDKLPARNINNIDDLLPWNWAEAKKKEQVRKM
jgi:transposase